MSRRAKSHACGGRSALPASVLRALRTGPGVGSVGAGTRGAWVWVIDAGAGRSLAGASAGRDAEREHAHHGGADGAAAEGDQPDLPAAVVAVLGEVGVARTASAGERAEQRALEAVGRRRCAPNDRPARRVLTQPSRSTRSRQAWQVCTCAQARSVSSGGELAVEQRADPRAEVADRTHHWAVPQPESSWPVAGPAYRTRPAPGARWASAVRSMARPRWMRERTVPSLVPRISAISS